MSRRGKEAADAQCDRHENILRAAQSGHDDQAQPGYKQQARTCMTVVTNKRARVTDDAEEGGNSDHRPFESLIREMMKADERQQACDQRQQRTVHRTGR